MGASIQARSASDGIPHISPERERWNFLFAGLQGQQPATAHRQP